MHIPTIRSTLEGRFGGARLEEQHGVYMRYSLPKESLASGGQGDASGVADLFTLLEEAKAREVRQRSWGQGYGSAGEWGPGQNRLSLPPVRTLSKT